MVQGREHQLRGARAVRSASWPQVRSLLPVTYAYTSLSLAFRTHRFLCFQLGLEEDDWIRGPSKSGRNLLYELALANALLYQQT